MSSKLQIINLALFHIGMTKITQDQLDADSIPSAEAANSFFEPARDDVFREHKWPFATSVIELDESDEDPVVGWAYMYDYPTQNVSSVWTVFNEATTTSKQDQDFEVQYLPDEEKKVILTNLASAFAETTYTVEDTSLWDNKFVVAFSYRLAGFMSHALLGDPQVGLKMTELSNLAVSDAKRIAGSEQRKKPDQTSSYQSSR